MPYAMRHTGLFTVVNTFTLRDPARAPEFERSFLGHAAWMRAQDGFDSHQAVLLAERPGVYVNIERWRNPESFQRVRGSSVFQAHGREFHALGEVAVDPSRNVLRAGDGDVSEGAPLVVVEWLTAEGMNLEEFDRAYRAYAAALCHESGFLHADLSRSLTKPGAYTFVTWWRDADVWRATRRAAPATGAAECAVHLTARQAAGHAR
ncbi:antibiotic biosynthesis monooxygenase [Streptomyces sp. LX-29]|uniref:antibiotic biosynthesis monooxygenase n=1 Tax=Streptomyces sp. LX-29 TaxID=2900152 RepID=UPI00240E3DC5|nr:antibiotic biosynthesis monooxygenase [Streptomyces sp. LX-29]WFB09373.1 antibiotic biosynthesis monooxygenase [Streptomyces sp. LX-29]